MLLCNISSDKIHICDAAAELFLDRNGIEKVLGPALLDWYDVRPFDQVLVINGPGGFTNLRVGALTRNLVAHLLSLRGQTLSIFSCTKIDIYRFFVKKGILPRFGYIYLGQRSMVWKYDFQKDTYELIDKDQIAISDCFCDFVSDDEYWKQRSSVNIGVGQQGCFLERKRETYFFTEHDLGLRPVPVLEAQYMIEI